MEIENEEDKSNYLKNIFTETYLKDILERNDICNSEELAELLDFLASSVGSLVTAKKLSDTFKSVKKINIHPETVKNYLEYFEDSFLINLLAVAVFGHFVFYLYRQVGAVILLWFTYFKNIRTF